LSEHFFDVLERVVTHQCDRKRVRKDMRTPCCAGCVTSCLVTRAVMQGFCEGCAVPPALHAQLALRLVGCFLPLCLFLVPEMPAYGLCIPDFI
jgi:hypothetical protein